MSSMNRRVFLRNASLSAVAATTIGCDLDTHHDEAPTLSGTRPNIVFIFSDDHSIATIGAYRSWLQPFINKHNITPNINSIAERGVLFEKSYCTNSICGPSRAVIQSGKFSNINGFKHNGNRFNGDQWTFPKALQKAGYQTAMIGKWHLGTNPQGYDYWDVLPGQGQYYNPDFKSADPTDPTKFKTRRVPGYNTDIVGDLSLDWLKTKRDKTKPFMLMMQPKAPHRNWQPKIDKLNWLDDAEVPMPETFFDDYKTRGVAAIHTMGVDKDMLMQYDLFETPPVHEVIAKKNKGTLTRDDRWAISSLVRLTPAQAKAWDKAMVPKNEAFRKANLKGKDLAKWKFQRYMKNYLRCIKSVDENIGRVLKYLKDNDLMENTIVLYSSDQGFYMGEHGWFDKRWMYEESFRMPFMAMWKGKIKPGQLNTDMIQNVDYAPTFCDLTGAKLDPTCQGHSLLPLMQGNTPPDWRKTMYYHYYEHMACHSVTCHYGVSDGRYKLMRFYIPANWEKNGKPEQPAPQGEWQLIDMKTDPNELNNVYGDPKQATVVSRLKTELIRLRAKYKDNTGLKLQ